MHQKTPLDGIWEAGDDAVGDRMSVEIRIPMQTLSFRRISVNGT